MLEITVKKFEHDEIGFKKSDWLDFDKIFAVHELGNPEKVVHSFLVYKDLDDEIFQKLIRQINANPPKSIEKCILFATHFSAVRENKNIFNEIEMKVEHENEFLNFILKDSFGKIVYNYQLENLYQTVHLNDIEDSISFRKSINKKDNIALEKSKEMFLTEKLSLFDVIDKHMRLTYTMLPNYFGGRVLYEVFNKS